MQLASLPPPLPACGLVSGVSSHALFHVSALPCPAHDQHPHPLPAIRNNAISLAISLLPAAPATSYWSAELPACPRRPIHRHSIPPAVRIARLVRTFCSPNMPGTTLRTAPPPAYMRSLFLGALRIMLSTRKRSCRAVSHDRQCRSGSGVRNSLRPPLKLTKPLPASVYNFQ